MLTRALLVSLLTVASVAHAATPPSKKGTAAEAKAFVVKVDTELRRLWVKGATADWIDATGAGDRFPVIDLSTLPGWPQGRAWFAPGQSLRWDLWTNRGEPSGDYNICGDDGMLTW